jgi:hypothetical protein
MNVLLSDLGAGALFAWIVLPLLALTIGRRAHSEPASHCRALTLVLLAGAALVAVPMLRRVSNAGADVYLPDWLVQAALSGGVGLETPFGEISPLAVVGAAWLAIALTAAVRIGVGLTSLRAVLVRSESARASLVEQLEEVARSWQLSSPRLVISQDSAIPFTTGVLRPTIVLPRALIDRLTSAEVSLILRHELAHIERADLVYDAALTLSRVVFTLHPIACRLFDELHLTRELAVDARAGARETVAYSRVLIEAASHARFGCPTQHDAVAMYRSDLGQRLAALSDVAPRQRVGFAAPLVATLLMAASAFEAPRFSCTASAGALAHVEAPCPLTARPAPPPPAANVDDCSDVTAEN